MKPKAMAVQKKGEKIRGFASTQKTVDHLEKPQYPQYGLKIPGNSGDSSLPCCGAADG
jgi:hypothetical protein